MSADSLAAFREPVRRWFQDELGTPTPAQDLAWPAIGSGEHTLVLAPTGSGKTLAAFLVALDHILFEAPPRQADRCRVLYVSPLKALAVDIERNLHAPLAGITSAARGLGGSVHAPEIAVRTGDTPGRERQRFARRPADIFITTPESFYLVLTSAAREALRSVQWVIVDEIHAMVGTKRGTHLSLSLERLEDLAPGYQRIGLSATQRPLEEVARFLGGFRDDGGPRQVRIADAGSRKRLELTVPAPERAVMQSRGVAQGEGGAWPAIHETLLAHIRAHRSTLVFVNSRRLAERLAGALNDLAGEEIVQAHHGSIAREQRLRIEDELKSGKLPAIVATSSLELGIDMGAIDLVIQIESPPSVSSAMQRIGRAGHQVDAPSTGVILPKHRGDLLACATVTERMHEGAVESMRYPRNPLDVLAQQIVAMVALEPRTVDDVEQTVRRAAPYRELSRTLLEDVLDMLSGRYPSHDFADLRPRITWNRADGTLTAREGARRVAVGSGGTIPNRGQYGVYLAGVPPAQGRVGELEEIMVFESRVGDVFLLGASSWRILDITHDRVIVSPAPGVPGRMPFWHGENLGRPAEFGAAIGALTRRLLAAPAEDATDRLVHRHNLTPDAARDLLDYLNEQAQATVAVPDDRTILIERHRDEMGEWRICLLTPVGSRVLAPWAMAIGASLRDRLGIEADLLWTEDGLVLRYPDADAPPPTDWLLPDPDEIERMVVQQLAFGGGAARRISHGAPVTAVFASHFREAAARALLLPQRRPGKRSPLWVTRKRAADLLHVVARYQDFPIVLETFRECLQDVFDMPALIDLLRGVRDGEVRVVTTDTPAPSPFASSMLFSYIANFMYEGDAPMAERRAQALTVDPVRLRQLLGEAELRDLLDAEALTDLERSLQCLAADRRAASPDAVHDMLLRLGDLAREELQERSVPDADLDAWLTELEGACRAVRIALCGRSSWIAAEDAARYRDALGTALPDGLPRDLLAPADDPLGDLLIRYARTHGPFRAEEAAQRLGLGPAPVKASLSALESQGAVVQGEFRPTGVGVEWCDPGVLRTLRARSLARLRREVEPVDQAALVRYTLDRHGVGQAADVRDARAALLEVIHMLQGGSIPASHLERDVLRLRLPDYDVRDLDLLLASGEVIWTGDGRLGAHDGRIRLLLATDAPLLSCRPSPCAAQNAEVSGLQADVLGYLRRSGASFFPAIARGVRGFPSEVLEALWDLVWMGLVTNDTMQPLRSLINPQAARRAEAFARRRAGTFRPAPSAHTLAGRPSPPTAAGRWSLVQESPGDEPGPTDRLSAWCEQLLDRYGVLTREAITAEGVEGGFSILYPVLSALEDTGRVRRGYFVEGLGATQFALPEAVDRLRSCRRDAGDTAPSDVGALLIAATDPACLYGASLPWPENDDARRPVRAAGAYVALMGGEAVAWLSAAEQRMLTFGADNAALGVVVEAIAGALANGRLDPFVLARIDGQAASEHPASGVFHERGFGVSSRGVVLRRSPR